jgi:hypothetical protein
MVKYDEKKKYIDSANRVLKVVFLQVVAPSSKSEKIYEVKKPRLVFSLS